MRALNVGPVQEEIYCLENPWTFHSRVLDLNIPFIGIWTLKAISIHTLSVDILEAFFGSGFPTTGRKR